MCAPQWTLLALLLVVAFANAAPFEGPDDRLYERQVGDTMNERQVDDMAERQVDQMNERQVEEMYERELFPDLSPKEREKRIWGAIGGLVGRLFRG